MKKYCVLFLLVLITKEAIGMDLRSKRQTEEKNERELEDRYGWNRPTFYPNQPRPVNPGFGQWSFPEEYPDQEIYPGGEQFPNQGQIFNQGQFPNQGQISNQGQFPNQGQISNQGQFPVRQTTTQAPISGSSTPAESNPTVQECIRNCPVTPEYNPVCGSNSVTYPNPGRLMCAQACGVSVNLSRSAPCPSTTAAPV